VAVLWREPLGLAEQLAQVAGVKAALDRRRRARAHAPQLDETGGRRLVELVALAVRRQRVLIELLRRFAPDHLGRAFVQLETHVPGDVALSLDDEGVQRVAE